MHVLILGGTGFVGRHLIARLSSQGHTVTVPTRRYARGRDLLVHPTATVLEADINDDVVLERLVTGADAVVNLVGILDGGRGQPYGPGFKQAHVQLPARVARICRTCKVRRLLHVSALGASKDAPSMYLRSKAAGEAALRSELAGWPESALTIFRPSVMFGPGDRFMNLFAGMARWFPVLPLAGAEAKMQPVFVGDVATAIAAALADPSLQGSYDLAGPQVYTLGELVRLAARWSGHPRPVIALPGPLGRMQAFMLECLPGKPMTRDNLDSLKVDSVSERFVEKALCPSLTPLEAEAPRYLAPAGTRRV